MEQQSRSNSRTWWKRKKNKVQPASDPATVHPRDYSQQKLCTDNGKQSQITSRPRVVRFGEENLVYHFEPVDRKDTNHVWYTTRELSAMKKYNTSLDAAKLKRQSSDPNSWSNGVLQVYRAFRSNCSKSDLSVILSSSNIYFDEHTIGLVEAAIPVISRDYRVRRRYLMTRVAYYQSKSRLDEKSRAMLIGETSILTSHVSRSFAVFTAHLLAGDE